MAISLQNLEDYCKRSGWNDTSAPGLEELVNFINDTLQILGGMRNWPFYQKNGRVSLTAAYTTGTAAITQNTTAVVGTTTAFTQAMVGQFMQIGSDVRVYEIASVTDGTHLTLAESFLGTTETVGAISIRYQRYATPSDMARCGIIEHRTAGKLTEILWELWQRKTIDAPSVSTHPTYVAVTPDYFYFTPGVSAAEQVWFWYIQRPAILSANMTACDWPERLRYLLNAALKERLASADRDAGATALYGTRFEVLANRAWMASHPSVVPQQVGAQTGAIDWMDNLRGKIAITPP